MLALQLKSGEYLTIGDDVVVQIFQQPGSSFRVEIKAPREVPGRTASATAAPASRHAACATPGTCKSTWSARSGRRAAPERSANRHVGRKDFFPPRRR